MTNAIEVENLVKRFGSFIAVNHLTFSVGKGNIWTSWSQWCR